MVLADQCGYGSDVLTADQYSCGFDVWTVWCLQTSAAVVLMC